MIAKHNKISDKTDAVIKSRDIDFERLFLVCKDALPLTFNLECVFVNPPLGKPRPNPLVNCHRNILINYSFVPGTDNTLLHAISHPPKISKRGAG